MKTVKKLLKIAGIICFVIAGYYAYLNIEENKQVGKVSAQIYREMEQDIRPKVSSENSSMAVKNIDGIDYIGFIEIPSFDLNLPVGSSFSYEQLKMTPALFNGSYYDDNMIICAHNYATHFGPINNLKPNDIIKFVNVSGEVYSYKVSNVEILNPSELEQLLNEDDWDLTLFSCTFDTLNRIIIRAIRI